MKQAVAYLRRSTDRQEQSIPDQRKAIDQYAAEHDITVVEYYVDDAVSGTSTNGRKDFERMMADSERAHRIWQDILVYDVSRFSRADNIETGHYLYLLRRRGVEVVYVTENLPSDHTGDIYRSLKQSFAHEVPIEVSRKTIRGLVTSAEQGRWLGGVPPYGYDTHYESSEGLPVMTVRFLADGRKEVRKPDGTVDRVLPRGQRPQTTKKDRRRLVLSDERRVQLVQRIFEMYVRENLGLKAIAERLNAEGIPSPRDGNWSERTGRGWGIATLQSILKNRLYTGEMVWNRRATGRFHSVRGREAAERPRREFEKVKVNSPSDLIVVPNAHPAIIDQATFDEAQRLMAERGRKHVAGGVLRFGRAKNSPYLLSGVMKCARCGHAFQGYSSHSRKHRKTGEKILTRYYACGGYVNKGNAVCERTLVSMKQVEGYVLERMNLRVRELLADGGKRKLRDAIAKELRSCGPDPKEERRRTEARLKSIDADINRLLDSLTPVNKEFVDKKLVGLGSEQKELQEELKQSEVVPEGQINPDELAEQIVTGLVGFEELLGQGTPEERKELVRAFVEKLVIDPDAGKGVLYIRQFPASFAETGKASFNMVAGAGFEPATFGL